jgi:hypothetical protein
LSVLVVVAIVKTLSAAGAETATKTVKSNANRAMLILPLILNMP